MKQKPRWQYRFDNFRRAYALLREICDRQPGFCLTKINRISEGARMNYSKIST